VNGARLPLTRELCCSWYNCVLPAISFMSSAAAPRPHRSDADALPATRDQS
jgi:hypothetical protein